MEARLDRALTAFEQATRGQMAVLTVQTLGDDSLEGFSIRVAEQWKLGDKERDDGLLLLVAVEERKSRLEVGQGFEGQIPRLHLVHHNQDLQALLRTGHRVVTYSQSFRTKSIDWWEQFYFGSTIHLSSVAPEVVEIKTEPQVEAIRPAAAYLHMFDGSLAIREVIISPVATDTIRVAIVWQALNNNLNDYGAAVQVVAGERPCVLEAIISQVAQAHLAGGSYPSSRLVRGEVVRDQVELATVDDARWLCIRPLVDVDGVPGR